MKRKWLGLALAAAMAFAGTAWADILAQDSAANYGEENAFVDGGNGGWGFGNWQFWNAAPTLADSTAGVCGDINSENGVSFRFARSADKDYCNGYRGFEALNPGDVLTFRFTCAYCGGNRGLDLFANGGHSDDDKIANVINLYEYWDEEGVLHNNLYSVNGTIIASNWAPRAVSEVTVTQLDDGIEIAIKRTSTEEGVEDLEYSTKVETSAKLTGIGLYAGGWEWKDGTDVENYAFYVNDLKIEGTPPADKLSLAAPDDDAWKVLSATEELTFTVNRTGSEGALEVALASSYPEFVSVPESVTIADGATSEAFTVKVALQGYGNEATVSAEATGVTGANYRLQGPKYRISADGNVNAEVEANFWVNWDDNGMRDDSKLSLAVEPKNALTVTSPSDWTWNAEPDGAYVASQFTAHESGKMVLMFAGVEMWSTNITVIEDSATLSGPSTLRVGQTGSYVLAVTLVPDHAEDTFALVAAPSDAVEISPSGRQAPDEEGNIAFSVKALRPVLVSLTIEDDEGLELEEPFSLDISEAPDYDDFIAYDDASLYPDGFDTAAVGEGTDKFQAWEVVTENSGGIFISDSAPDASVLTEGKAFGIWANGAEGAELQIRRPFVNSLGDGQAFSVVVSPNWRTGYKGVKFMGYDAVETHDWWQRAEFYYDDFGYYYKLEGEENSTSLGWEYGTDAITITLQKAADGSSYTLSFARGDEVVAKEGITSFQGTIDGVQFYSYQGGNGDENNFVFNSLAIKQVEEPFKPRVIGIAGIWNMDATGDYDFVVGPAEPGDPIGEVALSVTPDDGRITLSAASVDVPGDDVAHFTVTVNSLPGEGEEVIRYTITATPEDTTVKPAEFGVEPARPYVYLTSEKRDHTTDEGTIWLCLKASPAYYGTYEITSGNTAILAVPTNSTPITVGGDKAPEAWFDVTIVGGLGEAAIYATCGEETRDYIFEISQALDPAEPVRITAISIENNQMTLTLDPAGSQVFAATKLEDGVWKWQALDLAIIGDGTSVTVPMTDLKMMYRVE